MILLAFLATVPFLRSLTGEFLFDDPSMFEHDVPRIIGTKNKAWWAPFWDFHRFPRTMTGMVDAWLWRGFGINTTGMDANETAIIQPSLPWHVANLTLHLGCVWALNTFLRPYFGEIPAFLAAAVFAVHPLQVTSVCYVSGRAGIQVAFFTLLGLLHAQMGGWHWGLAGVSQYLAWKSKEDGILYVVFYGGILWYR